ncbi:MAG: nucleotide pyrophosphatase/phosphodiesterase family protein [Balneolales bacterium]
MVCLLYGSLTAAVQEQKENYVVIISIDGFPAEALWDQTISLPTIRSLALSGAWAEAMIPSSPASTWINHKTLVTGVHPEKHGLVTNGKIIMGESGAPVGRDNDLDWDELSTYPTLHGLAFGSGLKTAEVNWPNTRNDPSLHYGFPDAINEVESMTPQLRTELIELGLLADETSRSFQRDNGAVVRDYVWTETAAHLIRTRQPNLLLLHLLNVDGTHHRHGSGGWPGATALSLADRNVREILHALDDAGIRDQTTLFLVSDHGFMNVTKSVNPNVLFRQNGLIEVDDSGRITHTSLHVSGGAMGMIYATNPDSRNEDLARAREILTGTEGIATVIGPEEYHKYGLPLPSENEQMGDLVLGAAEGFSIGGSANEDDAVIELSDVRGTHGYLNNMPQMETLFIAAGRGIKSGTVLKTVDNRSVAPTAAWFLGLRLETADGNILEEIIE